jgi:centromere protein J
LNEFVKQSEKHHPDGMKEISFADKTRKIVYPNGDQVSIFPNGTTLRETADGVQVTNGDEKK